jgi:hypothetical protein
MATKPIGGITGVLGDLISPARTHSAEPRVERPASLCDQTAPASVGGSSASQSRRPARVGRASKSSPEQTAPKEKVTLRVNSDLIAEYRDWSWEARCQLGELVERALTTYRDHQRRRT